MCNRTLARKQTVIGLASLAILGVTAGAGAGECGYQALDQIGGTIDHVAVSGTQAVFIEGADFVVADVSNLGSPFVTGRVQLTYPVYGMATNGPAAYLANGDEGLTVIDFSNPAAPTIVSRLSGMRATTIQAFWPHLYVVDFTDWGAPVIRIINVLEPANPVEVSWMQTPYGGIERAGFALYAWDTLDGDVAIYSLVNPTAPQPLGTFNTGTDVRDIAVSGTTAFVACGTAGVKSYNVSNPAAVTPIGTRDNGSAYEIAISGTRAMVGDFEDLDVISISNAVTMPILGTYAPADDFNPRDLALVGSDLVIAGGSRLQLMSFSANPGGSPAGRVQSNGVNYDVAILGEYAYVAHERGFDVVALADADGPMSILTVPSSGDYQSLTRDGERLYVTHSTGLSIYDLAAPSAPALLGTAAVTLGQRPTVVGNRVYVAGESKLRIVDATNPASATQIGTLTVPNGSYRVAVRGDYAYLTTFSSRFHVIDISDPASPGLISSPTTNGLTGGVAIYGDYLLIGDGNAGLKVYSLADPTSPVLVAEDNSGLGLPHDIERVGSRAYIAWGAGVHVFEMSNPLEPVLVETLPTVRSARGVAIGATHIVAADDQSGLAVFARGTAGDLDQDGDCDLQDLATMLANFGVAGGAGLGDGDVDGDQDVDLQDLAVLLGSFGQACD